MANYTHIDISRHTAVQGCETFDIELYTQGKGNLHLPVYNISYERVQKIISSYPNIKLYDRTSRELAKIFVFGTPVLHDRTFDFKVAKAKKYALKTPFETDTGDMPEGVKVLAENHPMRKR